jgi:hypothetical protein
MTEPESSERDELLKADVLGRVRVRPEHRERMLDAFEAGAMSGQAFAIRHGIKVQTFASWMQKRRRKRGDYDDEGTRRRLRMPAKSNARGEQTKPCLSLIEVCVKEDARSAHTPPLEVVLPGGAVVRISSESQIGLLKTLLRELPC